MDAEDEPLPSKASFVFAIVLLAASAILVIPGSINMAVYWDSPKDDTCGDYGDDVPYPYPCSQELVTADICFTIGIALAILASLLAISGMVQKRKGR